PKMVRGYEWKLEVRMGGPGAIANPAAFKTAMKVADLDEVRVFAIWGKPAIGDGKLQDPGTEPLASSHFDAFHLRHATRWADGGSNLLLDSPTSIPSLVQKNIGHY